MERYYVHSYRESDELDGADPQHPRWDIVAVFKRYDEADALCCALNDTYHEDYRAAHNGWDDARPKYYVSLVEVPS